MEIAINWRRLSRTDLKKDGEPLQGGGQEPGKPLAKEKTVNAAMEPGVDKTRKTQEMT